MQSQFAMDILGGWLTNEGAEKMEVQPVPPFHCFLLIFVFRLRKEVRGMLT